MSVNVTVKTLDGIDRKYVQPASTTVREFKVLLSPEVGIAPERQRMIYHGRVLNDDQTLEGLDEKTVHLVERVQPAATPASGGGQGGSEAGASAAIGGSGGDHQRHDRREVHHHGVFVGSVAVPHTNLTMEEITECLRRVLSRIGGIAQNAQITSSETNDNFIEVTVRLSGDNSINMDSPARSRLFHVKHVLRHVNRLLDNLEAEPADSQAVSEEDIDAVTGLSPEDFEDSSDKSDGEKMDDSPSKKEEAGSTAGLEGQEEAPTQSGPSSDAAASSATAGTQPASSTTSSTSSRFNVRHASPAQLSEVMRELARTEDRLKPHVQRYTEILVADKNYSGSTAEGHVDSRLFQNVQTILHNIGHIYHAISDLNLHFCQPPPRNLYPQLVFEGDDASMHQAEAQITLAFQRQPSSEGHQQASADGEQQSSTGIRFATVPEASTPATDSSVDGGAAAAAQNREERASGDPGSEPSAAAQRPSSLPGGTASSVTRDQPPLSTMTSLSGNAGDRGNTANETTTPTAGQQPTSGAVPPERRRHSGADDLQQSQNPSEQMISFSPPNTAASTNARVVVPATTRVTGVVSMPRTIQVPESVAGQPLGDVPLTGGMVSGVIQPPSSRDAIFVGPYPPPQLPLFTFDPFLPCPSRHFDHRSRRISRPYTEADSQQQPSSQPQQATAEQAGTTATAAEGDAASIQSDAESEVQELERSLESMMRSVVGGMVGGPTAVGGIPYQLTPMMLPVSNQTSIAISVPSGAAASLAAALPMPVRLPMGQPQRQQTGPAAGTTMTPLGTVATVTLSSPANVVSPFLPGGVPIDVPSRMTHVIETRLHRGRDQQTVDSDVWAGVAMTLSMALDRLLATPPAEMWAQYIPIARRSLRNYFTSFHFDSLPHPSQDDIERLASRLESAGATRRRTLLQDVVPIGGVDLQSMLGQLEKETMIRLLRICYSTEATSDRPGPILGMMYDALRTFYSIMVNYSTHGEDAFYQIVTRIVFLISVAHPRYRNAFRLLIYELLRMVVSTGHVPKEALARLIKPGMRTSEAPVSGVSTAVADDAHDEPPVTNTPTVSRSSGNGIQNGFQELNVPNAFHHDHGASTANGNDHLSPEQQLPADWQEQVPPNWIDVIKKDLTVQRCRPPQQPFSDAYINGMPAKRRKVYLGERHRLDENPRLVFNEILHDSIAASAPPVPANAALESPPLEPVPELLDSFRTYVREKIRRRLRLDADYEKNKFPFTDSVFKP